MKNFNFNNVTEEVAKYFKYLVVIINVSAITGFLILAFMLLFQSSKLNEIIDVNSFNLLSANLHTITGIIACLLVILVFYLILMGPLSTFVTAAEQISAIKSNLVNQSQTAHQFPPQKKYVLISGQIKAIDFNPIEINFDTLENRLIKKIDVWMDLDFKSTLKNPNPENIEAIGSVEGCHLSLVYFHDVEQFAQEKGNIGQLEIWKKTDNSKVQIYTKIYIPQKDYEFWSQLVVDANDTDKNIEEAFKKYVAFSISGYIDPHTDSNPLTIDLIWFNNNSLTKSVGDERG